MGQAAPIIYPILISVAGAVIGSAVSNSLKKKDTVPPPSSGGSSMSTSIAEENAQLRAAARYGRSKTSMTSLLNLDEPEKGGLLGE